MIEKKVNEANRSLQTTRHLKRRSPRDRIIFISEKKENKIRDKQDQNKQKINIILIYEKKCRTSTFQKSFFIRTTRIWNPLITRLDLDNVTFENLKSVLYGYYSRALAINYDPDSPRSFKSICLK